MVNNVTAIKISQFREINRCINFGSKCCAESVTVCVTKGLHTRTSNILMASLEIYRYMRAEIYFIISTALQLHIFR